MRVGHPVRESSLEGMMEERARVMRVRMVGEFGIVSFDAATGFLSESRLVFSNVEGLGVMGAVASLGVNSDLTVCAVVGGGRSKGARDDGSAGVCCEASSRSGGP